MENNMPLVSIAIPVYNVEPFVEKCLLSVFHQSYQNLEIIVVDDCGQDASMDIVYNLQKTHSCGSLINVIKQPFNEGVAYARNTAIDRAKGKYLYFLDSDDFIEPETIGVMVNEAEEHQTDAVLSSARCVNYETGAISPAFTYKSRQILEGRDAFANYVCANLRWNITITSWNILFSLDFLKKNKLYFSTKTSEDSLFLSDYYSYIQKAILLPNITYNYVIRNGSLMKREYRNVIPVWEIRERFKGDTLMTERSKRLRNRSFYDAHCARVMKHKFRSICIALRHRKHFTERITNKELGIELKHPASFYEILHFKRYKLFNIGFYLLGKLPYPISVRLTKLIGKTIHWI